MKAYKGFNKNLQCTPNGKVFRYEIGKEYKHEGTVKACNSGFHSCEYPLDVFGYYQPSDSKYCEVEIDGEMDRDSGDSKIASSKIKIGAEIGIKGIIEAAIKFIFEKVDWENAKESNTGKQSAATNTGYQSAATNTGYQSAATNTGDQSAATNTGYQSAATNTGDRSAATNTGYQSAATNTGYRSAATNTGDQSAATNTGDQSAATNTGCRSAASVEGQESVAISLGIEGKAKGALGCWLVLAEWEQDDSYNWHRKVVKSFEVDGKKIKADTWYILKNGNAVKAE
jgi:hypothetical protein